MRACRDEGITNVWRIVGEPHYGGHIERLIGTQMGTMRLLPGTTHSNPEGRGDYDSAKSSRLTLRELERFIGFEIACRYHQMIRSELRRPPIALEARFRQRRASEGANGRQRVVGYRRPKMRRARQRRSRRKIAHYVILLLALIAMRRMTRCVCLSPC